MRVGVPGEVKDSEYRVAITPAGVLELSLSGHEVLIEKGAGEGSSIPDSAFERAGAKVVPDPEGVFGEAEMVLKVKEPVAQELPLLREGLVLFTYLHQDSPRLLLASPSVCGWFVLRNNQQDPCAIHDNSPTPEI